MRKLSAKIFAGLVFGILGIFSLGVQAQTAVTTTFGDPGSALGVGINNAGTDQGGALIDVIKSFINRALGMLALIALVVLLFGGFSMVTAAGDEAKYKKGFKILQQAGIGLVFIGVSWLMVSVIFWLLGVVGV
jgi:amino acid transporter